MRVELVAADVGVAAAAQRLVAAEPRFGRLSVANRLPAPRVGPDNEPAPSTGLLRRLTRSGRRAARRWHEHDDSAEPVAP
jgi:hypothetical protein